MCSFTILTHADSDWRTVSKNFQRTGAFDLKTKSARLDFTGLEDVSFDDPDKIFHSSGRSLSGNYTFGFRDIQTTNLFSGSLSTGIMVDEKVAYFATDTRLGIALDLNQKKVVWNVNLGAQVKAEPIVAGELIYFCDMKGKVTAVSKTSGGVIWQLSMKDAILADPLLKGDMLVITDKSGLIQTIDTQLNQKQWSYQLPSGVEGTPMIVEDKLWVGSLDGILYRFDLRSGHREYQQKLSSAVRHGMCLVQSPSRPSCIVVGTATGMLHVFGLDGQEWLHSPIDLENQTLTPIASRGLVYVCHEVSFFQIDPLLGEPLFEFSPSGQNFFGDLVFDGQSIHALVLKKSPSTTAKIVDVQFSFLDEWHSESNHLLVLDMSDLQWDGRLQEDYWKKAATFPLEWTSDGAQHFEKVVLKMALSKQGLVLGGSFEKGGGMDFESSTIQHQEFQIDLKQLSLDLEAQIKVPYSGKVWLNEKLGKYKNNTIIHRHVEPGTSSWSFEMYLPVSMDQLNQHQVFELNASYRLVISKPQQEEIVLEFCLNPRKDISSLLIPDGPLK